MTHDPMTHDQLGNPVVNTENIVFQLKIFIIYHLAHKFSSWARRRGKCRSCDVNHSLIYFTCRHRLIHVLCHCSDFESHADILISSTATNPGAIQVWLPTWAPRRILRFQNNATVNQSDDDGMWNISVNDCHHKTYIRLSVVLKNWIYELNASHVYIFAGLSFSILPQSDIVHYSTRVSIINMFMKLKYDIYLNPQRRFLIIDMS